MRILQIITKSSKRSIFFTFILLSLRFSSISQTYNCPSDNIFLFTTFNCIGCPPPTPIKVFNPNLPLSATNPTNSSIMPPTGPSGSGGLAFGTNIFAPSPSPTFYTNSNANTIAWWNGATWVNSGHNFPSQNFGFGGGIFYGITGIQPNYSIWKYDGTTNATTIVTVSSNYLCGDVVVDCNGDFYLLSFSPSALYKYNSMGTLLNTFPVTGLPATVSGSGAMAIVNGQIYINYSPPLATIGDVYVGALNGTTINFSKSICQSPLLYGDFADCSECNPLNFSPGPSFGPITVSNSGPLGCSTLTTSATVISTLANVNYLWSGPSILGTNTGSIITIGAAGIYTCIATTTVCPTQTFIVTTTITSTGSITPSIISSNILNCSNANSTLTANPSSTNLNYSWAGPGIVSTSSNIAVVNQAGVYSVSVSNPTNNCIGATTIAIINSTTVPNTNITASGTLVCSNSSITLLSSGAHSYTWSTNQNGNTIQINPTTSTTIAVVGMDSISNCTSSSSISINVISVPVPIVSNTVEICAGESFTLNASSSQAATSFNWLGPNGFSSSQSLNIINNSNPSYNGIYTVTATHTESNITCQNSNTVSVNVKAGLNFNLPSEIKTCNNQSLTISGPNGATNYNWYFYNQLVSTNQNVLISSFTFSNEGYYNLVIDFNGCFSSDSVKISSYAYPLLSTIPTGTTICSNGSYNFNLNVTNGSGNYSYLINPNQNVIYNTNSVSIYSITSSSIYTLVVIDKVCPNYSITETFSISVNSAPSPNFNYESNHKCEPLCLDLNSHLPTNAEIEYLFSNGTSINEDKKTVCFDAGVYTLTITTRDENGCVGEFSNFGVLEIYPKPIADFNYSPINPVFEIDESVSFIDASYHANISSWDWYFNSTAQWTSNQQNPNFTYPEPGNYIVTLLVTSDKGCKDTICKSLIVEDNFAIYVPNTFTPNNDGINDLFGPKGHGIIKYELMIYDRWGERIFSTSNFEEGWNGKYRNVECKEDVYVWKINITTNSYEAKELTGSILLMR